MKGRFLDVNSMHPRECGAYATGAAGTANQIDAAHLQQAQQVAGEALPGWAETRGSVRNEGASGVNMGASA